VNGDDGRERFEEERARAFADDAEHAESEAAAAEAAFYGEQCANQQCRHSRREHRAPIMREGKPARQFLCTKCPCDGFQEEPLDL